MSETTVVAKPAAPEKRARVLPAAFISLNGDDYAYRSWYVNGLPPAHEFADLFHPYYWSLTRVVRNDIVRVSASDGSWDVQLKCIDNERGSGAIMELWPKYPAALAVAAGGNAAAMTAAANEAAEALAAETMPRTLYGQPVPRIEPMGKTFALIGVDGNPHKEGIATQAAADKEYAAYCKRMKIEP